MTELREQIAYEVARAQTSGYVMDVVDVVIEFMARELESVSSGSRARERARELRALKGTPERSK